MERKPDGRYIDVKGRSWRAAHPNIPRNLVAELASELMAARRAVGHAQRSERDPGIASARRRVSDAEHARADGEQRGENPSETQPQSCDAPRPPEPALPS